MTTSTIGIADLIKLLDQPTLDALSARLHQVLDGTESPSQLLFEFIDSGITDLEESKADPDGRVVAEFVLAEIPAEAIS
jgi:hypothetical protein